MKYIPTVKAKAKKIAPSVAEITQFADEKGDEYKSAAAEAALAEKRKAEVADAIKKQAAVHGTREENRVVLIGSRWKVGFTETESYALDYEEAKNRLAPALLKALTAPPPPPALSPTLFQKAVEEGKIDKVTAGFILVRRTPEKRILVTKA